jgi:hypothetical protein
MHIRLEDNQCLLYAIAYSNLEAVSSTHKPDDMTCHCGEGTEEGWGRRKKRKTKRKNKNKEGRKQVHV